MGTVVQAVTQSFVLGETVTITHALVKSTEQRSRPSTWNPHRMTYEYWRIWKSVPLRQAIWDRDTAVGIVIGTRTLMNVERYHVGYEEGWDNNLSTAERFQAVWVSYDLRRKPVFVLPEDAHRIGGGL